MSLIIAPRKNHLPTSDAAYLVHSQCSDTVTYDELLDILAEGNTTLTRPDAACNMELLVEKIAKLVADGKFVQTPLGSFYLCASGTLSSADQAFTPRTEGSNHDLQMHFRPNRALGVKLVAMAKLERGVHIDRNSPFIVTAKTIRTKTENTGTPGELVRLEGERLSFDDQNEATGLFFVNGKETRSEYYVDIKPGHVIAEIPPTLTPGSYSLVIRSVADGTKIREGRHEPIFTVV